MLAISKALLFPEPSMYSEKSKSVAVPVPLLLVVTEMVLLDAEVFPAASFAYTFMLYAVEAVKPVIVAVNDVTVVFKVPFA
ncbi:hypothetical protein D3C85_1356130 [compost metagenome]